MSGPPPLTHRFASAMARLGPFEPAPLLGIAVSGGADSLALALLADDWARTRGGSVIALVVDHGLRPTSHAEAMLTVERLRERGIQTRLRERSIQTRLRERSIQTRLRERSIQTRLRERSIPARLLQIAGLRHGPAMAERARVERYRVLVEACAEAGCLHLLLGHHRADQGETVMMRALRDSRSAGLAAMPALSELATVRLLRPLLCVSPADLRGLLRANGMAWVEDPSNQDPAALRSRLRMASAAGADLADAAAAAGAARAGSEALAAEILAERVTLRPEGFALLSPGRVHPDALGALLQTVAGAPFPPPAASVERLAAQPGPATLAGVRILAAGRLGRGWLLVREAAAIQPPIAAAPDSVWDGRFRLTGHAPPGAQLGALGTAAAQFRSRTGLPDAILRTLPALRCGLKLVAVPHLGYSRDDCATASVLFCPPRPMAGASFWPALVS